MTSFRPEDVQQILQRAMAEKQQENFSEQQLQEMAAELGISFVTLQTAQQEWQREKEIIKRRQASKSYRLEQIKAHLISYLVINVFLIVLNLVTSPNYFWAIYPLLGWGLGLGLHISSVYLQKR
ncbi:2TM domain-containing protein [Nostoc sp. FACHB-152]|uniref:2TM domain-containing protein n=1 Tax=unclassified Nostoc TaxID=2593658 RepID=UPI00168637FA|nr:MULTISPECIES: 2TM domain-containing protein [unclassified Nostoc]MBD2449805.1 2TM domain-containing protein [Nostoc sp. FACHB-152]MBD2473058.1 2TM domain-containing protein [Nostoc sp. FACHB-145]